MGWKGESRRHSLSRKGIKTAQANGCNRTKKASGISHNAEKLIFMKNRDEIIKLLKDHNIDFDETATTETLRFKLKENVYFLKIPEYKLLASGLIKIGDKEIKFDGRKRYKVMDIYGEIVVSVKPQDYLRLLQDGMSGKKVDVEDYGKWLGAWNDGENDKYLGTILFDEIDDFRLAYLDFLKDLGEHELAEEFAIELRKEGYRRV